MGLAGVHDSLLRVGCFGERYLLQTVPIEGIGINGVDEHVDVVVAFGLSVIGSHGHLDRAGGKVDAVAGIFGDVDSGVVAREARFERQLDFACGRRTDIDHKAADVSAFGQRVGIVDFGLDQIYREEHRVELAKYAVVFGERE